jgi:hypothetical protein
MITNRYRHEHSSNSTRTGGGRGRRRERAAGLASVLLWGGWLVVTAVVFSFMAGIIHPYYTVALAPAIAALTAIGAVLLWRSRGDWPAHALLAGGVAVTAGWSYVLLDRMPSWYPPRGGFNGTDPAPTLAEFQRLVANHKIHYFVGTNADSFGGGSGDASAITKWVTAHFKSQTVGGETVYNLTQPRSAG